MIRAGDTLLLATKNRGKTREFREAFAPLGVEVIDLNDLADRDIPPIVEDGATFEENARIKARAVAEATGLITLADDSGLCVDRLGGAPGVHSARYAGPKATDAENNAKLLEELRLAAERDGAGDAGSAARFVCCLVLYNPATGETIVEEGTVEGRIVLQPSGTGGFGYDPVFWLPSHGCTMAELPIEEKNRISHRGAALRRLIDRLSRAREAGGN
ncbi:MAG: non-canonical purine NTP pyrophosphatase, RdgB/HAM1 family [Paenibacillaceae bacterium ZCTH02-B3]|mgnify:FL=1|nr:MAG: non-canonical purine NTP pyrophosphatase, RdgB/HAM1 family [Paenibacillaceae bacterium ZCTH02-B3]